MYYAGKSFGVSTCGGIFMQFSHETIRDDAFTQLYFKTIEASNELLPAHWHAHLEILCILNGKMTAYINESSYQLLPGDILVVNPKDIHYTHVHGNGRYDLLQIPSAHLSRMTNGWEALHFTEYLPQKDSGSSLNSQLNTIFSKLRELDQAHPKGYRLLFLIQIYELLYLLYTEASTVVSMESRNRSTRDFNRMEQSMQYVRQNFRHPITLSQVAAELSLTPEYFCRLFKKYTGQSFLTYVSQVRLLHFHDDLLHTKESITYLLEKNGITNYKTFLPAFKAAYGTTPQKLRQQDGDL